MHKIVNGKKIRLTKKQEKELKAEWARAEKESASRKKDRDQKYQAQIKALRDSGIGDEAIKVVKPSLKKYLKSS